MVAEMGRILIVDDEDTFRNSTADLLRREGYLCDCSADAGGAMEMLGCSQYDLLIADIMMPGNVDLQFVREVPGANEDMPIILVTGYPAVDSAIEAIKLPVVAYLVKPFPFEELRTQVLHAVERNQVNRAVSRMRERLDLWQQEVAPLEPCTSTSHQQALEVSIPAFLDSTLRNVLGSLADLKQLTEGLSIGQTPPQACHLFNCPRLATLKASVEETIHVLERTKRAFKSRELGELRKKLEAVIKSNA